jgi:SprT protein
MKIETPKELLEAKVLCGKEIDKCVYFIQRTFAIRLPKLIPIFDIQDSVGGYVRTNEKLIHLNPTLLQANPDEYFNTVIPHEVCHLAASQCWPKCASHGKHWALLMSGFGLPPTPCHRMDVRTVPNRLGQTKNPNYKSVNSKIKTIKFGKIIDLD